MADCFGIAWETDSERPVIVPIISIEHHYAHDPNILTTAVPSPVPETEQVLSFCSVADTMASGVLAAIPYLSGRAHRYVSKV